VTAVALRPRSSRLCASMNSAVSAADASTSRSPVSVASPPEPATRPTPPSAAANPAQASGPAVARPRAAAASATSAGTTPMMSAAWLTLVRAMPRFCSSITAPKPVTPHTAIRGVAAERSAPLAASASSGAASTKRAAASDAGSSQPRAAFDSGIDSPHSSPAAVRAAIGPRRWVCCVRVMQRVCAETHVSQARFDISA
jgi:hypothetical protein